MSSGDFRASWQQHIRIFHSRGEPNAFAIDTSRVIVLVDVEPTTRAISRALSDLQPDHTGRPIVVVNTQGTHASLEHKPYSENLSLSFPEDLPSVLFVSQKLPLHPAEEGDELANVQPNALSSNVNSVGFEGALPKLTYSGGVTIEGGNLSVSIIPTPGHSDDQVAVWVPDIRVLLPGESAESPIPTLTHPSHRALAGLRTSLKTLAALNAEVVIPSYGDTTDPDILRCNIAYLDELETATRRAILGGALPSDWRRREDLAEILDVGFHRFVRDEDLREMPDWQVDRSRRYHLSNVQATVLYILPKYW